MHPSTPSTPLCPAHAPPRECGAGLSTGLVSEVGCGDVVVGLTVSAERMALVWNGPAMQCSAGMQGPQGGWPVQLVGVNGEGNYWLQLAR